MKTKLTTLLGLLFCGLLFAQTTLVSYQFNNNLTPDPGAIGSPTLQYYDGSNNVKTPAFNSNMLSTNDQGDYLELSVDASLQQSMILSFYGDFAAWFIAGEWIVSSNTGPGNAFQELDRATYYSIFNVRTGGNFSVNLPASADNKSNLKIRIGTNFVAIGGNLRLDNLKLSGGTPKILVSSNSDIQIPHLSPASIALTTDFGTRQTSDPMLTRTFRVRNYLGTNGSQLNVSDITVTGANPGDFTVTPTTLSNIGRSNYDNGSPYKTFDIGFLPLSDGIRTAEINVYSNAAPSPYTFTVIGTGASCSLISSTFAVNTMAPGQQSLESDFNPSTDLIGGQADNSPTNSLNTILYPNKGNLLLSVSSPTAWYVRNAVKVVEFGGTSGLDISAQKNVSIEFSVAAFGTSSDRGVNNNSTITLSVLKPDLTWSDEMTLRGSAADVTYYNYGFGTARLFESTYDGDNSPNQINNRDQFITQYRYKTFRLNLPASAAINSLKFRIRASTPNANGLWLIDDVRVVTSNSVFKTFTTANVWSPSPPEPDEKAIIEGNYTNSGNPTICECEVAANGSLTIPANTSVTVKGKIINNGDGSNFIVQNDGNLLQVENDAVNSGDITVQRNINLTAARQQYNYVISPVVGQNIKNIYKDASGNNVAMPFALSYAESTNMFMNSAGTYVEAKGFAVKEPTAATFATGPMVANFKGLPFNGTAQFGMVNSTPLDFVHGYNLIGNPYPSNMDLEAFYNYNDGIDPTFYFWDSQANNLTSQQGNTYGGQAYATYNAEFHTGLAATGDPGHAGTKVPNQSVKVGQGFIARSLNASLLITFQNKQRNIAAATGFFGKGENAAGQMDRFWLNLTSPSNIASNIAVVYMAGADSGYTKEDSRSFLGSDAVYSIVGDEKISINGKSAFENSDIVQLGTNHFAPGNYTISLAGKEGTFANGQSIYLKDNQTGIITNLSQGDYTFAASAGESTGRFEIVYKPDIVLVTDSAAKDEVMVYRDGQDFVVKAKTKNISTIEVYDSGGRMFYKIQPHDSTAVINAVFMPQGVYILKTTTADGAVTNKKILK
ncbi:T9SS type A sorting domain-containing protein [Kaistella palustris]|uniref:T9SS type A sorting domain-containing protein n=1 Tax=Kaistella palustris TaxID=493376 RepID=UPI00146EDF75|nr:T9SS type A sorting domain-containing protein [Kaistella palustris]